MPSYVGPFDCRRLTNHRLLEILWRAEAELAHIMIVGCPLCRAMPNALSQAIYERERTRIELVSRGMREPEINKVADFGFRAGSIDPELHEFRLSRIPTLQNERET